MFQTVGRKTCMSRFETSPDLKLKMTKEKEVFCVFMSEQVTTYFFIPQPAVQVQSGVIEYFVLVLLQDVPRQVT